MKKTIAILGSTGSIGTSTLNVIKKNLHQFKIEFLSADSNYKKLIKQAKIFKAKNVCINNKKYFEIIKKRLKGNGTHVHFGKTSLGKIISKKIDYTMSSIVGVAGLEPTIDAIKFSKVVAIANKEAIICGWNLLSKYKKIFKTKLLPIDSEHFSIMQLSKDCTDDDIEEIIITASGGPFLKTPIEKLKRVKPYQAIKHPNWNMGKKISVDSANLMNKVFELIEAHKLFKFNINKYKIIIHPQSYVHSIIRFKNGIIKMILHDTDMKIPISNTIFESKTKISKIKNISSKKLSQLTFFEVDSKRYPAIKLIKKCLNGGSLAPTILNASNEELVSLFLNKKIKFTSIVKNLNKVLNNRDFGKYAKKTPKSINDIYVSDEWARLKTRSISVK